MSALSRTALAQDAGVSRQSVHKAVRAGRLIAGPNGEIDPSVPANSRWIATHREGYDNRGRPLVSHTGGRPASKVVTVNNSAILEPANSVPVTEIAAPVREDPGDGEVNRVIAGIGSLLERQDAALLGLLEAFEKRLDRVETLARSAADQTAIMAAIERSAASVESLRVASLDALGEHDRGVVELLARQTATAAEIAAGNKKLDVKLDGLRQLLAALVRTLADRAETARL
jgi:hypothetical protein